eukprot:TRINITY_DN11790_c0_g1_i11.p1 TRINITY_DN11790_c0_g1~~TRINITY_DN11790_c0_g1_i11.p1  ORF type:complete len:164 (+),score=18.86 TRINITY_DN11790_c0_g1_i11:93-584(+)
MYSQQFVQLFVNGVLDSQLILRGLMKLNGHDYMIGKDLNHPGTECFIDDLRFYDRLLRKVEIQALTGNDALGIMGTDFVTLGCQSCSLMAAVNACPENYHLCSRKDLYSGAYHVARVMRWTRPGLDIWARTRDERDPEKCEDDVSSYDPVSYTHLTLPTIYSV